MSDKKTSVSTSAEGIDDGAIFLIVLLVLGDVGVVCMVDVFVPAG